jgi:hypothetical protein
MAQFPSFRGEYFLTVVLDVAQLFHHAQAEVPGGFIEAHADLIPVAFAAPYDDAVRGKGFAFHHRYLDMDPRTGSNGIGGVEAKPAFADVFQNLAVGHGFAHGVTDSDIEGVADVLAHLELLLPAWVYPFLSITTKIMPAGDRRVFVNSFTGKPVRGYYNARLYEMPIS